MIFSALLSFSIGLTFQDEIAKDLKEFTEINSGSQNSEGIEKTARWTINHFKQIGFNLEWNPKQKFLLGTSRPQKPLGKVLLVGHLDTVFEKEHPFQQMEQLKEPHPYGPVLRGPGVVDAKGGIILIQRLLRDSNLREIFEICVFIAADEEVGSKVSRNALIEAAQGTDLSLVFEPGWIEGRDIKIPTSVGGSLLVHLEIQGPEGHIATSKSSGLGTADQLMKMIQKLGDLRSTETSMNVFDFKTESKSNVIAGKSTAKLAFRFQDPALETIIQKRLERARASLLPDYQLSFEVKLGWAPTLLTSASQVKTIQKAAARLGQSVPQSTAAMARGAGTFLASAGFTVYESMGPLGVDFHSSQEVVYVGSFDHRLRLIAELLKLHFNFQQIEIESMGHRGQRREP